MVKHKLTKIEITLPVYNEEEILKKNTQKIIEYLEKSYKDGWHITIAENGSSDNTFKVAKEVSTYNNNVSVIQTDKGRGNAIKKSWQKSNADYLIYMDIDLSTQPEEISKLVEFLKYNDMAIGSRFLKESDTKRTIGRKIISRIYNFIVNKILGIKIKDSQCGFKGIRKDAKYLIEKVIDPHWFFDTELIYRAKKENLKIVQVPISWNEREEETRKSKVNIFIDSLVFLKNIFTLRFENKILLPSILVFVLFSGILFFIIKDSPGALCPDSFYHAKIAQTIWETKNLVTHFSWLPFTVLGGSNYVDHHMLFHIINAPFIGILGFYGFKISTALFGGSVFTVIYFILKRWKTKESFLWTLSLAMISGFIYRIILFRAMPMSIFLLLLTLYFIKEKKYNLLFIVSFVFVWTYNAFPLAILIALLYFVSQKILNEKAQIKQLSYLLMGIVAGIFINPYYPKNIIFYKTHLLLIPFLNGTNTNFTVGAEWYPMSFNNIVTSLAVGFLLFSFAMSILLFFIKKDIKRLSPETLTTLFLSGIFFLLMLKSQRFVEYWAPFTILAAALSSRDVKAYKKIKYLLNKTQRQWPYKLFTTILCLSFITFTSHSLIENKKDTNNTADFNEYQKVGEWLKANTKDKSTIINVSWDSFPKLYYWADKNNYVAGMDLMFLCGYDAERCKSYNKLINNKDTLENNYLQTLKSDFNTDIVFISKDSKIFEVFKNNNKVQLLYEDKSTSIFKII